MFRNVPFASTGLALAALLSTACSERAQPVVPKTPAAAALAVVQSAAPTDAGIAWKHASSDADVAPPSS